MISAGRSTCESIQPYVQYVTLRDQIGATGDVGWQLYTWPKQFCLKCKVIKTKFALNPDRTKDFFYHLPWRIAFLWWLKHGKLPIMIFLECQNQRYPRWNENRLSQKKTLTWQMKNIFFAPSVIKDKSRKNKSKLL